MDERTRDPLQIRAEDINPRYNWGRHLPVLGTMGVDFEERVDYRRMHRYRLARAQAALEASDLGALLLFDDNNIRYVTSTKIGEWARDKLSRWALLTRGGDPILWDFGSAAVHHKLYSPWLKPENCKAGLVGFTRSLAREFGSRGITANVVAPGFVETALTAVLPDNRRAELLDQIPLRRYATSDEIATVIRFLASDDAAYITGAVIPVDGGLGMGH